MTGQGSTGWVMTVGSTKVNRQKPYGSTVLSYKVNQGYTLLVGVSDELLRNLNTNKMKINKLYSVWSNDNPRCNYAQQVRANSKQDACLLYSIYNGVNIDTVQVAKLIQPRNVLVCPITRPKFSPLNG